jgi:hypothetical protein
MQELPFGDCHGGGRLGPQAWTGIRAHVSQLAAGPERPCARASSRGAGQAIRRGSGGRLRLPAIRAPFLSHAGSSAVRVGSTTVDVPGADRLHTFRVMRGQASAKIVGIPSR